LQIAIVLLAWIAPLASFGASWDDSAPAQKSRWRNFKSSIIASFGGPVHTAQDVYVFAGERVTVQGKFAYGKFAKDLEGEAVSLWVRPEVGSKAAWQKVGETTTNGNGEVSFALPERWLQEQARLRFEWVVGGDLSRATGLIRVLEKNARAVVFDIDGTLTQGDREVFEEVLLGATAEEHAGAAQVTQKYAAAGFEIVYLTGRPYLLAEHSRRWLKAKGFAPGIVRTTQKLLDTTPSASFVQEYKVEQLDDLILNYSLDFRAAYGNASTDICAYAIAGLPIDRTFIIGKNAGKACEGFAPTQAIASYPEHVAKGELEPILKGR
jgi:phosphatidate phosphatase PAH1